jgi:hypothetical protein
MRVICNEYKIDGEKLIIEHDIIKDDYYFRVIDLKTFKCRYESEAIAHVIPARAKAFEFMGVQTS